MLTDSVVARFWPKVDRRGDDECWPWLGSKGEYGHGTLGIGREHSLGAHRIAYLLLVGPVPEGLQLDHLCRNPPCVNPKHLEPVTPQINNLRGFSPSAINARKAFCLRGHPLEGDNLRINPKGYRVCHACRNLRQQESRRAAREARTDPPQKPGGHLRRRTSCPQGHPYDAENTYINPTGSRMCRECMRQRNRARRAVLKATS